MNSILCFCRSVPVERVINSIESGNRTLEKVIDKTGAGTDCQSCHSDIYLLLDKFNKSKKDTIQNQLELFSEK